jgi:hypothetical protein
MAQDEREQSPQPGAAAFSGGLRPAQFPLASAGVLRYCPGCAGDGPRTLIVLTALDDIPARPPTVTLTEQG